MNAGSRFVVIAAFTAGALIAACAPKPQTIVLVPDREAHVGQVAVSNTSGSVVLDRANDAVTLTRADRPPSQPRPMDPAKISAMFSEALAAEPPAPMICRVYFGTGSSDVDSASLSELQRAIAEISRRDSRDISIDGHSDTTGTTASNMTLSLARAQNVRDALVKAGIAADRITMSYHGMGNLLVPTAPNVDEPKNRRVEIVIR